MSIEKELGSKLPEVSKIIEKLAKLRMEKSVSKTKDSLGKDESGKENSKEADSREKEQNTLTKELFEAVTGKKSKALNKETEKTKSDGLEPDKNQNPELEDAFTRALRKALEKPKDKAVNAEENPLTPEELLSKFAEEMTKEAKLEKDNKKEPKAKLQETASQLDELSNKMKMDRAIKMAQTATKGLNGIVGTKNVDPQNNMTSGVQAEPGAGQGR
ncbi:MAG: hypothetical protein ACJAS6_000961 [Rickettsiales bacterium]|jgi:hypothetical protein